MNLLQRQIAEASQKYYENGTTDLTDNQFDALLEQERKENPNSPLLDVGHGYQISKDTTQGQHIKHYYGVAGSLDKCHNWKEFPSRLRDRSILASLKLDGLSVVLYYKNGELALALTRGERGEYGIEMTDKAKRILKDNIHLKDKSFCGAVRGEILMSYQNFDEFQSLHPEAKNPRNSAAGLINSKEITDDYDFLDIVVYTVVGITPFMNPVDMKTGYSYKNMIFWLHRNFEKYAPVQELEAELTEATLIEVMERLQNQWYGIYPADGIVLTDNESIPVLKDKDVEIQYNAVAFKFKAESAITKVIGHEWNLSKSKYLFPRIQLETVQLSGTNVSWCTGTNARNMLDSKLGIGSEVEVLKSGEIIPYIDRVVTPVECEMPTTCPCCGTELVWSGVHLMCPNMECADSDIQDVIVWMENIAPFDGLGDVLKLKYLTQMFHDDISIDKIYQDARETSRPSHDVYGKRFTEMYDQLFDKPVELATAIKALNIPRFGEVTSTKLAAYPDDVRKIIEYAENQSVDLPDMSSKIGEANYNSLVTHVSKFKRLTYIMHNIIFEQKSTVIKGKVAITGKLSVKRGQFEAELKAAGYQAGNISKDTNYLITDDPSSSSDKNTKADMWGIVKISEEEFRKTFMRGE